VIPKLASHLLQHSLFRKTVSQGADHVAPTGPGKTGMDGQRDHKSTTSRPAGRSLNNHEKAKDQHISMAKRNNVWMTLECARMSRDILAANGVADEYPIFRDTANLESVKTYEGTHDIHTLIIGQSVTGIDAF